MATFKYHSEIGGEQHGNRRLHWPGTLDGFPFIGEPGDLKQQEVEDIQLQYDYKSKMFELWDVSQKSEFDDINDKIVNGWYRLLRRNDNWDEDKKHFRVWLEWCQVYGMSPTKNKHAMMP
ncbi:hypothetical protein EBZ39_01450 [bacterium]|nr:hypothetical protein [bacterium]